MLETLYVGHSLEFDSGEKQDVTLQGIESILFPELDRFLEANAHRHGVELNRQDQFPIEKLPEYFQRAQILALLMRQYFGQPIAQLAVDEFLAEDFEAMQRLVRLSSTMIRGTDYEEQWLAQHAPDMQHASEL